MLQLFIRQRSKISQRMRNRLFLLGRALRLLGIFELGFIVVLTLNDAAFLLYLCEIEVADLQSGMLQDIFTDFLISCFALCRSQMISICSLL